MTRTEPSAAAMRAAERVLNDLGLAGFVYSVDEFRHYAAIIDAETGQEHFQLVAALRGLLQSYVANSQNCGRDCNGINAEDDPAVAVARDVLARVEGATLMPTPDATRLPISGKPDAFDPPSAMAYSHIDGRPMWTRRGLVCLLDGGPLLNNCTCDHCQLGERNANT